MKRLLVVALVATGLGMGACGGDEKKKDNSPTFTPAADAQAIVGSWGMGDDTVSFESNGTYTWSTIVPCGAPPCPTKEVNGKYTIAGGKIMLDPTEGNDRSVSYSFESNQTKIDLEGKTFSKK